MSPLLGWGLGLLASGFVATPSAKVPEAPRIAFREFLTSSGGDLRFSPRLEALRGKRVKVVGFMAQLEASIPGAFYLCARPVSAGEGGGGMGDLPPAALLVLVPWAKDREIPALDGPLEATGRLELGPRVEPDGQVSALRLILDDPSPQRWPRRKVR